VAKLVARMLVMASSLQGFEPRRHKQTSDQHTLAVAWAKVAGAKPYRVRSGLFVIYESGIFSFLFRSGPPLLKKNPMQLSNNVSDVSR
jgi:hypothetical protein